MAFYKHDAMEVWAGGLRNLRRTYMRRRYSILFYSLLLILVAVPILNKFKYGVVLIDSLLAANLLAAIMPVNLGKNRPILLAVMIVLWLTRPLALWLHHRTLSVITFGIWTLIGLTAAAAALRYAFRARTVDAEHVYAALSAYLLAGLYFGLLYWVLEQLTSGAFTASGNFSRTTAIYFSFVTLATLGYGDIVPRTDVARSLAVVEAVGGQLFLVVLVARLVSLYSTKTKKEP
jgi:voltage-gated potassium channel Kch